MDLKNPGQEILLERKNGRKDEINDPMKRLILERHTKKEDEAQKKRKANLERAKKYRERKGSGLQKQKISTMTEEEKKVIDLRPKI